jgi:hypothetical protein
LQDVQKAKTEATVGRNELVDARQCHVRHPATAIKIGDGPIRLALFDGEQDVSFALWAKGS